MTTTQPPNATYHQLEEVDGAAAQPSLAQPIVAGSAMPVTRLLPDTTTHAATCLILSRLLETIRANEQGIKADTDIEFLHEYRVAVRRTRAALSQIRDVFPPDELGYFRREFRNLGRRTNDLRDLDVFLSMEPEYRDRLPESMREDIAPLFAFLRLQREGALAMVITGLESEPYNRFLDEWDRFLRRPIDNNSYPNAHRPVIEQACRRINRQYHVILGDGALALYHPDDEDWHNLRIECKKLRYLLEFFADLFPPDEVRSLLKQLKRLQNNLGAVSDLGDQQKYLAAIAEASDIEDAQARRTLVAVGYLIGVLGREQQAARADFTKIFRRFSSPVRRNRFLKMLDGGFDL